MYVHTNTFKNVRAVEINWSYRIDMVYQSGRMIIERIIEMIDFKIVDEDVNRK